MEDAPNFWLSAADAYLAEAHAVSSSVRASELAVRLSMTPARLATVFRRSVGMNLKSYLRARQIERAKELLRNTDLTPAQVAVRAGFGTARTLYRVFREHDGTTPAEYRKELSLDIPDFRT